MAYVGLKGCERMVRNLMDVHGLTDWTFRWSNARKQAGSCSNHKKVISLSRPIAELWGAEGMRETALHEIAHALAGSGVAAHGAEWKAVCRRIGAEPKACYTADENTPLPPMKYVGTCPIGHVHRRSRMPKRKISCGQCANRFDPRHLITWAENPDYR
jgi:predicted SprT family Zn-dependent metalloprotease